MRKVHTFSSAVMHNFTGSNNLRHPETNPHFEPPSLQTTTPIPPDGDHYPIHLGSWGQTPAPPPRQPHQQEQPSPSFRQQQQDQGQQPGSRQWEPHEREVDHWERRREPRERERERERERQRDPRKKDKQTWAIVPPPPHPHQLPPSSGPDPRIITPAYPGQYPSGGPALPDARPRIQQGLFPSGHQLPSGGPDESESHHRSQHPSGGPAPRDARPRVQQGLFPSGQQPTSGGHDGSESHHPSQHPGSIILPQKEGQKSRQSRPHGPVGQSADHGKRPESLVIPREQKTNCITWFGALFCAIFWVLVILGGIIVLIVYLVFRPRSPQFNINHVTLNAAYLDMGSLLNADLTVLANFTNPNKKVSVDFSSVSLDLNFGNTLIATQYVHPFKAARSQTLFADIHMVTSQVRLSVQESELLKKQIANNRVVFEVLGIFHARSMLGNLFGYSYRLFSTCRIEVTSPPTGVLRVSKCKTKR